MYITSVNCKCKLQGKIIKLYYKCKLEMYITSVNYKCKLQGKMIKFFIKTMPWRVLTVATTDNFAAPVNFL